MSKLLLGQIAAELLSLIDEIDVKSTACRNQLERIGPHTIRGPISRNLALTILPARYSMKGVATRNVGLTSYLQHCLTLENPASLTWRLFQSQFIEHEIISTMANQCLICLKQLKSKAALKGHTGTADPTLCKPYVCCRCDRPFCSQKVMEQHRDSPAHATFSCDVCNKTFRSKQAVTDHQKSARHNSMVNQAGLARWASMGAAASTGSVRSHPVSK